LLLDTSVLIDNLRGDQRAARLLKSAAERGDELWSITVVRTEILVGLRPGEERRTAGLLDQLCWQDVTIEIADRAGSLARRFAKSHPGVDTVDYLLAAAAESLGGELKTLNVKHFPMFPKLQPAYR
jgi:predicted nucleic acid-binding protein